LAGFYQRAHAFDISLNAHITQDDQRRLHRCSLDCRNDGHDERYAALAGNSVLQQVDGFNMEVSVVEVMRDANPDLVRLKVSEGTLNRFFHWSLNAAG
jgi:hypothetical protein